MFSERIYEKMYNGSRSTPALERGVTQADESRRRGVIMEAIAGVDIAVWDVKAQALGIPLYQALGAVRSSVRGYASGGWAPGDEAEAELGGLCGQGLHRRQDARGRPRRVLDRQLRAAGEGGPARASAPTSS